MTALTPTSTPRSGQWPPIMGRVVAADAEEAQDGDELPICVGRGKYQVICQIGRGSFGNVFLARSVKTGKEVALKVELATCARPKVPREVALYNAIGTTTGIPRLLWHGTEGQFNMMVMQLVGANLEDLFSLCNGRFSPNTALRLASQMLPRISHLHSKGFIHGDLKPENFAMGLGQHGLTVFLLDFGLTRRYLDPETDEHIPYAENKNLTGTARYASINTHLGIERSRRDDLESLAYIIIYFIRGGLPWQGIKGSTKKEKYRRIGEKKVAIPIEDLVRGYPSEVGKFLRYVRALRFEQKPNYSYLTSLVKSAIAKIGPTPTHIGDVSSSSTHRRNSDSVSASAASVTGGGVQDSTPISVDVFDWNVRALELCEKGRVDASRRNRHHHNQGHHHNHNRGGNRTGPPAQPQYSWYSFAKRTINAGAARERTVSPFSRATVVTQTHRQMQNYAASKRKDLVLQGKFPQDPVNQGVLLQRHRKIRLMTYLLSLAMAYPHHPVFGAFHMSTFDSATESEDSEDNR